MPPTPFVSVVTVSLNAALTISDTIASVAMQQATFAVEHICVDGGSVDATRAIINGWAERFPSIVRIYEPDTGTFDAMNKGLRAARGEYVLFLNADDFFVAPDSVARAMAGLQAGSPGNPDLVAGNVTVGAPGAWGVYRHLLVPRLLGRLRGWGLFPLHQAQFTKRTRLDSIGGFDTAHRSAADVIQYYELERRFPPTIRRLDSDVAFMRAGGASNQNLSARYRGARDVFRWLLQTHTPVRAFVMVLLKSAQTLSGLRIGRCPHQRWFAEKNAQ